MSDLGSWVGLYHWVIEKLMRERLTAERDVLTVLAMRANPLGFCWPGVGYIAQLTGRADATVEKSLVRLELIGYIAVVKTQNPIRNRLDIDYQVRPDVMLIAPELCDEAFKLWRQNCNVNITIVIKESQPPPGTRILEPAPGNQHHNHHHHQAAFRETESAGHGQPGDEKSKSQNAGNGNQNSGAAAIPPAAKPQLPNPTPVPPPPSPLVTYPEPLPDEAAEQIAAEMNAKTRFMMSLATARGLIVRYGPATCRAALVHMALQTNVNQPAGYLRFKIESAGVDPVRDAKIPVEEADEKVFTDYVSGKYAAWIKYQPDENEQESRDE